MEPELIAAIAAIAGLVIGALSARRSDRTPLRQIEERVDVLCAQVGSVAGLLPEPSGKVRELAARGEKMQAIKAYREENPGTALKDAKDRIDALARPDGHMVANGDPHRILRKLDGVLRAFDIDLHPLKPVVPEDVVALTRAGRKIEAIKLLREMNPGMGLAEAKERVESI